MPTFDVISRGRLSTLAAPAGEATIVRWVEPTLALDSLAVLDSTSLPSERLGLTSVIALAPRAGARATNFANKNRISAFGATVNDSQRVAMWREFSAQAGTYEIAGDTLVVHSQIAKSPNAMAAGAFQKYRVWADGKTIWCQLLADNTGPLPHQERVRLARIE